MCFLKTECHLDLYMTYIILSERILEPFYKKCVYLGRLKYKTLYIARHLSVDYFLRLI